MSELESLRALDSAIEYLTGEYDEEFPMVAGLISLRASLASMTQERDQALVQCDAAVKIANELMSYKDALTQERDQQANENQMRIAHEAELANDVTALYAERNALAQERDALQAVIEEARLLHVQSPSFEYSCEMCNGGEDWPCPTFAVLAKAPPEQETTK
jgi:hypothetical protein